MSNQDLLLYVKVIFSPKKIETCFINGICGWMNIPNLDGCEGWMNVLNLNECEVWMNVLNSDGCEAII